MPNFNSINVVVFSVDLVFTEVIKRILEKNNHHHCNCQVLTSFSDAITFPFVKSNIDLIIVDNFIIGRSSYELIAVLRAKQQITIPIVYFGVKEYNGGKKGHLAGADLFFTKPFKPDYIEGRLYDFLSIGVEAV